MTELALHLNDPSSRVIRFDMETLPEELSMQVFQWLNSDFSDHGSDVMSFNPTYGGTVVLHRSQVLFATVGRVRFKSTVEASAEPPVAAPDLTDLPPPPAASRVAAPTPKGKGLFGVVVDAAAQAAKAEIGRPRT